MTRYSWRDVPTVVTLSDYLKENKQHGVSVVLMDKSPAIHCDPGVTPADKDRWAVLEKALALFRTAEPDMQHLLNNRMIKLPGHPGWR
jgi:hypothetical protein